MTWVSPMDLQTIFVNIFAGDASYFAAIAIFFVICLSAFFRMNGLTLGLMLIIFLMMFSGYMPVSLVVLIAIIGGLIAGFVLPKIIKKS